MSDLISRQAAIDALNGEVTVTGRANAEAILGYTNLIADRIKRLPSAEVEPVKHGRWVPVSERLPEDLEEVNVTWVNHIPEPYYAFLKDKSFTGSAVYYRGDWYWYSCRCTDILAEYGTNGMDKVDDGVEIIAWMPLPEPYKEGEAHEQN